MLCMSHRLTDSLDGNIGLLEEEISTLLSDAQSDPSTSFVLGFNPTFHGMWTTDMIKRTYGAMAKPGLYQNMVPAALRVLYRSRMFLTQSDYLGFGNIDIEREIEHSSRHGAADL